MNSRIKIKETLNHKLPKEIISGPKVERNQILYILLDSPNYLVQRLFIGDDSWKPITLKFDNQLLKNIEEQLDLLNIGLMLHLFETMGEVTRSNRKSIKLSKNKLSKAVGALYGSNNLIQTYHSKFNKLVFDDQPNSANWIITYVREVSNILTTEDREFCDEFIKQTSDPLSYRRLCVFGGEFSREFYAGLKKFEKAHSQKVLISISILGSLLFFFYMFMENQGKLNFADGLFTKKHSEGVNDGSPLTDDELKRMLEYSPPLGITEESVGADLNLHPLETSSLSDEFQSKRPDSDSFGDSPTSVLNPPLAEDEIHEEVDVATSQPTASELIAELDSIEQKESNNVKTLNDLDFKRMLEYSPPPNSIEKPKKPGLIFHTQESPSIPDSTLDTYAKSNHPNSQSTISNADEIKKEYIDVVRNKIYKTWLQTPVPLGINSNQKIILSFNVFPEGTIDGLFLEQSATLKSLNDSALKAVTSSIPLAKFPKELMIPKLHITISFKYVAPS